MCCPVRGGHIHSIEGLWFPCACAIEGKCQVVVLLQLLELLLVNEDSLFWYRIISKCITGSHVVMWVQMHHQFLPLIGINDCWNQTTHANEMQDDVISLLLEKYMFLLSLLLSHNMIWCHIQGHLVLGVFSDGSSICGSILAELSPSSGVILQSSRIWAPSDVFFEAVIALFQRHTVSFFQDAECFRTQLPCSDPFHAWSHEIHFQETFSLSSSDIMVVLIMGFCIRAWTGHPLKFMDDLTTVWESLIAMSGVLSDVESYFQCYINFNVIFQCHHSTSNNIPQSLMISSFVAL